MSRIALIIAGGNRPPPIVLNALPPPVFTIAADSGVDHARALDLIVDAVVGDFDSASPQGLDWARRQGALIESHPTDKDQTDLELALAKAASWIDRPGAADGDRSAVDELVVIGLDGGRIDHLLANLLTLAGPHSAEVPTTAYLGPCRVSVVRTERTLRGRPGEVVTLLAVGGRAEGITTRGLAYPLTDEHLETGSARGVSNVFATPARNDGQDRTAAPAGGASATTSHRDDRGTGDGALGELGELGGTVEATVSVRSGILLALQPHALSGAGSAHPPTTSRPDA
ncbi:MAG: thiamine diphosphokinase [Acidimicrobiia bacterium]|nr:thiamine diphosphokinase [Acidimicrobiia bacterium]